MIMRRNPQRLAWTTLILSFLTCVSAVVLAPLGARWYILNARAPQNVTLEVQQGPLRVRMEGRGEPISIAEDRDDIRESTEVATHSTAGRLVIQAPNPEAPVVTTVQLYDNTDVVLSAARSPRFAASRLPHQVALEVRAGRVRVNVSNDDGRGTVVDVETPHGAAAFIEGSYEVKVNTTTTEIIARYGQATVVNEAGFSVSLGTEERAIISSEHISGPRTAARNLVANGDFQLPLDRGWTSYSTQTDPEQPLPTADIITDEGRQVISFHREGTNHAEVGIRQEINYDVRDFAALQLHLAVRVIFEDILGYGGCGYLSSECPIIIRLSYEDVYGTDGEWYKGFYTGEPSPDWLLYPWAEQIPAGSWQTYDSANLMEELADAPPAFIKSLTIYASGHSFHAMLTEVEVLAQE